VFSPSGSISDFSHKHSVEKLLFSSPGAENHKNKCLKSFFLGGGNVVASRGRGWEAGWFGRMAQAPATPLNLWGLKTMQELPLNAQGEVGRGILVT
jgi:hypothetical protein